MAYVTYVYPKRADSSHKTNGHRKHNHITPVARRVLQIVCGFLIGLLVAYAVGTRRAPRMCSTGAWLDRVDGKRAEVGAGDERWRGGNSSALLFVGVMTAQKYLGTRATAVYRTWGNEVPGRIAFFSSATSELPAASSDLPLVRLKNVDDSYPPQKKSFLMLQYMWERHGDEYEWFLRADDDVYIRPDKIEAFLRSVNSSKPHFIGQAGRGNQEEFGLLSLEYDENFCMGGPGIILSRETLKRVAPHVKYCLQNLYTTHEDVELGRCVQKFARIPCTWSYEMQSIFYHNFSGNAAFTASLKTKEVHRAITLHPIKQHEHMYRVHNYMQGLKIHNLQQRKIGLYRDLHLTDALIRSSDATEIDLFKRVLSLSNASNDVDLLQKATLFGMQPDLNKYRPRREDDVFSWDLISRSVYSDTNLNPRRKIESHLKEGLDDVIREVMDNINLFSRERGRVIEFQQILYGYYRLNPLYGPDYILDVLLTFKKYRGKKMTVPVRRHAYIQQQFVDLEIREAFESGDKAELDNVSPSSGTKSATEAENNERLPAQPIVEMPNRFDVGQKTINFMLPLFGRHKAFLRFLQTYEDVCLRRHENVSLLIVLFVADDDEPTSRRTLQAVDELAVRYRGSRIKVIRVVERFARAKALDRGLAEMGASDLLFFVDVDMVWTGDTLRRIRLNTVAGKRVYFPIVFSEFDPSVTYGHEVSPDHFLINNESGYWRIFGFGIMSVYKTDIQKVGGFDTSIVGWGKEDVDLFEKFLTVSTNVSVFRAVDPSLVHIFHIVDCDSSLDIARLTMCRNTRSETYGSVNQLANLAYKYRENVFQYALAKIPLASKPNR